MGNLGSQGQIARIEHIETDNARTPVKVRSMIVKMIGGLDPAGAGAHALACRKTLICEHVAARNRGRHPGAIGQRGRTGRSSEG